MKKSFILLSAMAIALLAQVDTASAQIRWGRGSVPRAGACFYQDSGFRGEYFCASLGQTLPSVPNGMGDRISSIRTFGGAEVTVFRDRGFRGGSARFSGDVDSLRRNGWNDTISSIRIEGGRFGRDRGVYEGDRNRGGDRRDRGGVFGGGGPIWGRGPMTRDGACFFEDSNFRGRYFCVERGASIPSLPAGFNDKISSIRLFGRGVEIFVNDDFRGRSSRVTRDVPRLGSFWGDRVSSLRVF